MELSKKTWHAKLYCLTYGIGTLPNNLCPYFWKIVIAMLLFVPLTIFFLPRIVFNKLVNRFTHDDDVSDDGYLSVQIFIAIGVNVLLFVLFCMAYMWFIPAFINKDLKLHPIWVFGSLGYILTLIVTILIFQVRRKEKRTEKQVYKKPEPNIFIEFVKAKYNRYCPKIDWKK